MDEATDYIDIMPLPTQDTIEIIDTADLPIKLPTRSIEYYYVAKQINSSISRENEK